MRGRPFHLTIAAAGDVLAHSTVTKDARRYGTATGVTYDYAPMFARVAPILGRADLAICHMETPLSKNDTNLSVPGRLVFNTPHEMAAAVKGAGYDGCDFASNHTWDQGRAGLASTVSVLHAAGLQYAGPTADPKAPRSVAHYTTHGVRVAQLAYSYTVLNDWGPNTKTPPDAPWTAQSLWPARKAAGIIADARAAKRAGADIVVVSLHWGAEYITKPTKDQTSLAAALLASKDVDLILGTHVHVVQPCQTIHGKYVFYGLGNSLSNQAPSQAAGLRPETQEGMIATVTISRDDAGRVTESATYQPTRVRLEGHVIEPVTKASNATTWSRVVRGVSSLGSGKCSARPTGG